MVILYTCALARNITMILSLLFRHRDHRCTSQLSNDLLSCNTRGYFPLLMLYTFFQVFPSYSYNYSCFHFNIGTVREFCDWETFNARCQRNHTIMMREALFGRMRNGRCVHAKPEEEETLGCQENIIGFVLFLTHRCSCFLFSCCALSFSFHFCVY